VSAVIAITPPCAWAQSYPSRPITLVVPLPPGGTNDIMARAVADKLGASLGQQVVVENRAAGGSGTVGTRQAAKSAPDGYTLLLGYTSTLATGPSMHRDVGYDPRKDFAPIGLIASAPSLLLIHPSIKTGTVADLIALMKAADQPFQIGVPGIGTVNHLASGLPGFDAVLSYGLLAPAGTPRLIIERLNKELRAALVSEEVRHRLLQEGAEPMPTTPEEHAAVIDREESKWSAIIRSAGIKAE